MTDFQKFTLPSVIVEELARSLSDAIVHLRYEPGARIIEEDLCAKYGVSRSPVREALRVVEADGLVVRVARRGARVALMNQANLTEVYACRMALEGLAASEAARSADPAAIAHLETLLASMESARAANQIEDFFQHNVAFTRGVHRATGNETLQKLLSGIEKQSLRYRYLAHQRTQEMLDLSQEGHRSVLQAIENRQPALARSRAVRLIRYAHRVIARSVAEAYPVEAGGIAVPAA